MRQMRLEKREIKDPAELEKVLDACKVVRIGTMDAEGMFIVPVNFGYEFCQKERSLKLYIHSAKEGRKAEAISPTGFTGLPQPSLVMVSSARSVLRWKR